MKAVKKLRIDWWINVFVYFHLLQDRNKQTDFNVVVQQRFQSLFTVEHI